jgi:hypothetical protein
LNLIIQRTVSIFYLIHFFFLILDYLNQTIQRTVSIFYLIHFFFYFRSFESNNPTNSKYFFNLIHLFFFILDHLNLIIQRTVSIFLFNSFIFFKFQMIWMQVNKVVNGWKRRFSGSKRQKYGVNTAHRYLTETAWNGAVFRSGVPWSKNMAHIRHIYGRKRSNTGRLRTVFLPESRSVVYDRL